MDQIVYRPHKNYQILAVITFLMVLICTFMVGLAISRIGFVVLFASCDILFILATKFLYDLSLEMMIFDDEGIVFTGKSYNDYYKVAWDRFSYGRYVRNFKGFTFLFLSGNPISEEGAKGVANYSMNTAELLMNDSIAVIPTEATKNFERIKELVNSKIGNVAS